MSVHRPSSCARTTLLPSALAVLLITVPGASQAWVAVQNKALSFKSGLVNGPAPASQPIHIAVSLRLQDRDGLASFIRNSHTSGNPQYGQTLSTAQFNATYAPTAAQAQAVVDYLTTAGFSNVVVAGNRAVITANGTVALAQKAFNTSIVSFGYGGKTLYGNSTDVQVPDSLKDIVLSIAGINNIEAMHLHRHASRQDPITASAVPGAGAAVSHSGYTGPQFAIAYDAGKTPAAYATKVAIVTEGDDLSTVVSQLRLAERVNGQPVVPVKIVQLGTLPSPQDTSGDDEWDLDSQSSTGIAGNVNELVFYNTVSLNDADLIPAVNQFAVDNLAQIGNQSYGGCEAEEVAPLGDVGAFEQAFMQAVAQGQTWFASTGDTGSGCGSPVNTGYPTGVPNAEYPASSPNIIAAGGTTLSTDKDFNYVSETSWIGGGGGISDIFAPPKWQVASGAVPSATVAVATGSGAATGVPDSEAGAGRGTPDVAMSADPASGLSTYVGGSAETVGGTSLSSPLSAGAYARLQTAHCNKLGFGAPQFYALDTTTGPLSTAKGFNDVTSGTNGAYASTTGWDYNTGFGSFDITAVHAALPPTACTINQPPVAKLTADTTVGNAPSSITFSGAQSTDPEGDPLVQYVIDFGDNSDLVIQSSPTFPAHPYTAPGTYVATLSVRDAVGNASLPTTLPVTIYGTPTSCTLPGQRLVTSPPGVALAEQGVDLASKEDDLLFVDFAEPANLTNKLVVTMKVDNLSSVMAGFRWVTYFNTADGTARYIAMVSADGTSPVFNYGLHTYTSTPAATLTSYQVQGSLDAASTYNADGTITLILDKAAMGLKTGDTLSAISASVRTSAPDDTTGTTSAGQGLTQDAGTATQTYTLVGNDVCAKDIANPPVAPVGTTTGGSSGTVSSSTTGGTMSGSTTGTTSSGTTSNTPGGSTTGSSTTGTSGTTSTTSTGSSSTASSASDSTGSSTASGTTSGTSGGTTTGSTTTGGMTGTAGSGTMTSSTTGTTSGTTGSSTGTTGSSTTGGSVATGGSTTGGTTGTTDTSTAGTGSGTASSLTGTSSSGATGGTTGGTGGNSGTAGSSGSANGSGGTSGSTGAASGAGSDGSSGSTSSSGSSGTGGTGASKATPGTGSADTGTGSTGGSNVGSSSSAGTSGSSGPSSGAGISSGASGSNSAAGSTSISGSGITGGLGGSSGSSSNSGISVGSVSSGAGASGSSGGGSNSQIASSSSSTSSSGSTSSGIGGSASGNSAQSASGSSGSGGGGGSGSNSNGGI